MIQRKMTLHALNKEYTACIVPSTVTVADAVSVRAGNTASTVAMQPIKFSPRFSSATDRVRVEEAVSMKPVTACTPLEEGMPFTVQDNLGSGLPLVVHARVTLADSLDCLLTVIMDGFTAVFLTTVYV